MVSLSPEELIKKFPYLKKFEDQKWFFDNSINQGISEKEIPLHCCLILIKNTIEFLEKTKFNSHWESCFSVKTRLEQIEDLLRYFCKDSQYENSKKSNN